MNNTMASACLATPERRNPGRNLVTVPVPRSAPPDERRVAYTTLLADHALRNGRSLLPTGEPTEALVTSGLIHEEQLPHVASAYMKTCAQSQARAWDAVPRSWTLPRGWQTKLGRKAQLVEVLRAELARNPAQ